MLVDVELAQRAGHDGELTAKIFDFALDGLRLVDDVHTLRVRVIGQLERL